MLALAVGGPVLKRLAVFTRPVVSRLVPSGARAHASSTKAAPTIEIWFVEGSGKDVKVLAREGESLLEVAHRNGVDMEGACEASVACSTCHVILERDVFESLSEASEKEEDMLDQAPGLSMTYGPPLP